MDEDAEGKTKAMKDQIDQETAENYLSAIKDDWKTVGNIDTK